MNDIEKMVGLSNELIILTILSTIVFHSMVMTEFTHKTEPVSRSHIAHAFILMLSLIMIATITRGEMAIVSTVSV